MAMPPISTPPPSHDLEVEDHDDHRTLQRQGIDNNQLVLPEDGYAWKKYGQKYITRIRKNRSYFRCRNQNCGVKKRVEWLPSDLSTMRIVYEGAHNHPAQPVSDHEDSDSGGVSAPNPYELANQMFGNHP